MKYYLKDNILYLHVKGEKEKKLERGYPYGPRYDDVYDYVTKDPLTVIKKDIAGLLPQNPQNYHLKAVTTNALYYSTEFQFGKNSEVYAFDRVTFDLIYVSRGDYVLPKERERIYSSFKLIDNLLWLPTNVDTKNEACDIYKNDYRLNINHPDDFWE